MKEGTSVENEIVTYVRLLYDRGLTSSLGGNVSSRLNDVVYISPTHIPCYRINEDNVSVVTITGKHIAGKPPSSELPTHLAIYQNTNHNAIIHTHSHYATTLACLGRELQSPDVEGERFLGRIPLVPYLKPGTPELATAVVSRIKESRGVLLENHGALVAGTDLEEAFISAEAIERSARLIFDLELLSRR